MTNHGGGIVMPFGGHTPRLAENVYVAPGAAVIGDVDIGAGSSVWFNTIVRGDQMNISIGENSNIQDGSVVHITSGFAATHIGSFVLIGHQCIIHGCTIRDYGFVGMGSIVLDNAVIESDAMLAAGSMLTPGKVVPSGQLWGGRPAKYMRDLTPEQIAGNRAATLSYAENARCFLAEARSR